MRTYNIDESRQKDDDDGEDAHQRAVQSGVDYLPGESLQGHREQLGEGGRGEGGGEDEWS